MAQAEYSQRSWRNWQTRYVEVVVPKGVEVRVLLTAPLQQLPTVQSAKFSCESNPPTLLHLLTRPSSTLKTRPAPSLPSQLGQLPANPEWQTTHGAAVDSAGLIYITHWWQWLRVQ